MIADRAARIVRMRAEGRRWHQIAAELKVSQSTAHKHGERAGAPYTSAANRSRQADERALEALALRRRTLSFEEVGRRLGVNRRRAHALCKRGARVEDRRARAGRL